MTTGIRRRRILIAALAGATFAALGITVASSRATETNGRELLRSTELVAPLEAGATYGASLIDPTPSLTSPGRGWFGAQFVDHQRGKVRYETAVLFWRDAGAPAQPPGSQRDEIDIISGPAMTLSPAATLAQPLSRIGSWNFSPYQRPSPVKRWTVAGRQAVYFDASVPKPGRWVLVGSNPPERPIDHDNSFRMAALSVRGKTVVVIITAPVAAFPRFLPIAKRLVASLRFQSS
jgi:hypothetical protein